MIDAKSKGVDKLEVLLFISDTVGEMQAGDTLTYLAHLTRGFSDSEFLKLKDNCEAMAASGRFIGG